MTNLIHLKSYRGKFDHFYKEYIEEFLPPIETVERIHSLLVNYINDENTPLILRKFASSEESVGK